MKKTIPESNPYRMDVPTRRDQLSGEGVKWYDRASWLAGKTLQIPARERTVYQKDLDELWGAVTLFEEGRDGTVDTARIERIFTSAFERWSDYLGEEIPSEIR
jgi:hypothetical protein